MSNKLSVILLSYKSGNKLITVKNKLHDALTSSEISYELIIVDDRSQDVFLKLQNN